MPPMSSGFHRRSFLAAGFAAMTATGAEAAAKPFFKRHGLPIGLQIYTLGLEAQVDLPATFAAVAGIGYRAVELPGLLLARAGEVRAALDKTGLVCPSVHVQPRGGPNDAAFNNDLGKLGAALNTVGVKTAVAPIFLIPERFDLKPQPGEDRGGVLRRIGAGMTVDDWKLNADFMNDKARGLKASGIKVAYHNHNFEFAPLGDTNGFEILLKHTDPSLVSFELDVGWVAAAGRDPAEVFAHHKGRFTQMHVKDIKASSKPNYVLSMDPTEVGSGTLDWKTLLPAAWAAGVRGYYLEQEPPFTRPRIEAAKIGHDFLAKLVA